MEAELLNCEPAVTPEELNVLRLSEATGIEPPNSDPTVFLPACYQGRLIWGEKKA